MTFKETMAALFSTSQGTYYKWKKENRPIISLLDKYFTQEDLEEFLETGEIFKLELLQHYDYELLEDVSKFFYDEKSYFDIDFLLAFLYLSKDKLLDNKDYTYNQFDSYLFDILEDYKKDYQIKSNETFGINNEEFGTKYKDLHIALLSIKFPVFKYLIYNLKHNFKPLISTYQNVKTSYAQDVILMIPFAIKLDFKNIMNFKNKVIINHLGLVDDKLINNIIMENNDIDKINDIIEENK